MTTYYVRNGGNDSGAGRSEGDAWATVAKVNAQSFAAGDSILFRCGDTWREKLTVPSSGSSDSPITFGSYSSGDKPVITGLATVSTWADNGSDQWTATVAEDPYLVIIDGDYGLEVANQVDVTAEDEWHWASNVLTIYSTADPDIATVVEYPTRDRAADLNGKDWINFDNIRFEGGRPYTFFTNGASDDCTWTDCDFYWGHEFGFLTQSGTTQNRFTLTNCRSQENGAVGIQFNAKNHDHVVDGLTSFRDSCSPRTTGENQWGGGIKLVDARTEDTMTGIEVKNSTVSYAGVRRDGTRVGNSKGFGVWIDLVKCTEGEENIVHDVTSHNNAVAGFFCEKSDYSIWYRLLGYNNYHYGLIVGGPFDPAGPITQNNKFYHFTMVGNGAGGSVHESNLYCRGGYNPAGAEVFTNNEFKNYILEAGENHEFVARDGAENDGTHGSGNTYQYMALGAEYAGFIEWGGGVAKNTYADWETAYGSDLHEIKTAVTFETGYKLPAGADCVDAGVAITGYNDDYTGTAPDLGYAETVLTGTAQFTPDTFLQPINVETGGHGPEHSLWRHYAGVIPTPYVVIITDGVANETPGTVSPSLFDLKGNAEVPNATASYTGADAGSGDAGRAVFTGGITYTVTSAEETILLAAGYTMDS